MELSVSEIGRVMGGGERWEKVEKVGWGERSLCGREVS